jgi:hypothetical protein
VCVSARARRKETPLSVLLSSSSSARPRSTPPPSRKTHTQNQHKQTILALVAAGYLGAFVAFLAQAPALLGDGGLAPAGAHLSAVSRAMLLGGSSDGDGGNNDATADYTTASWPDTWRLMRAAPTLLWLHPRLGLSAGSALALVAAVGAALAACVLASGAPLAAASPPGGSGRKRLPSLPLPAAMLAMWALYGSLLAVGQGFWGGGGRGGGLSSSSSSGGGSNANDALLQQVGWAAAWLAPWRAGDRARGSIPPALLLARWASAKAVLMTGAARAAALCSSSGGGSSNSSGLGACLAQSAAALGSERAGTWAARAYLPPAALDALMALVLALELPLAALALAPWAGARRAAAAAHALLLLLYSATGVGPVGGGPALCGLVLMLALLDDDALLAAERAARRGLAAGAAAVGLPPSLVAAVAGGGGGGGDEDGHDDADDPADSFAPGPGSAPPRMQRTLSMDSLTDMLLSPPGSPPAARGAGRRSGGGKAAAGRARGAQHAPSSDEPAWMRSRAYLAFRAPYALMDAHAPVVAAASVALAAAPALLALLRFGPVAAAKKGVTTATRWGVALAPCAGENAERALLSALPWAARAWAVVLVGAAVRAVALEASRVAKEEAGGGGGGGGGGAAAAATRPAAKTPARRGAAGRAAATATAEEDAVATPASATGSVTPRPAARRGAASGGGKRGGAKAAAAAADEPDEADEPDGAKPAGRGRAAAAGAGARRRAPSSKGRAATRKGGKAAAAAAAAEEEGERVEEEQQHDDDEPTPLARRYGAPANNKKAGASASAAAPASLLGLLTTRPHALCPVVWALLASGAVLASFLGDGLASSSSSSSYASLYREPAQLAARVSQPEPLGTRASTAFPSRALEFLASDDGGATWRPLRLRGASPPGALPSSPVALGLAAAPPPASRLAGAARAAAAAGPTALPDHLWVASLADQMLRGAPAAAQQLEPGEAAALAAAPPSLVRVDVVEYALQVGRVGAASAAASAAAGAAAFVPAPEGGGWWLRRRAGAMLPPLARGDQGVREALAAMGWPHDDEGAGAAGQDGGQDAAELEDPTPALLRLMPLRDRPAAAAWAAVGVALAVRWRGQQQEERRR